MTPALLLAVASLLPTIPMTKFMGCPPVYQLKAPGSSPGFNIVFVSAGFQTDADLENYRCAVAGLVNGLLAHSPWKEHACQLGFYRMDIVAVQRGIGVDPSCTDLPCDPQPLDVAPPASGCPVALEPPPPVHTIWPAFYVSTFSPPFDIRHCREGLCRFVWPSWTGQAELLAVVDRCMPPAQAIVVVANSILKGGGGGAGPDDQTPGLAVITVDEIGRPYAWRRLAHELGHVVGLLDEYDGAEAYEAALGDYVCDRNVFTLDKPCGSTAPWESSCSAHQSADCGPSTAKCQTVVHDPNCNSTCNMQGTPSIALYEGAFGQDCGYFRSQEACLMRNYAFPACGVCGSILDDKVDSTAGICHLIHHPMKLSVTPQIELDWCPTPPRPPIPFGDEREPHGGPAVSKTDNPACARRDLPVRGIYARVAGPGGVRGEVVVRRAWIEAGESPGSSQLASLDITPGRDGSSRRLLLSLGGDAVSPSEWIAEIQRRTEGSMTPVLRVIDDVTGAQWTADELTLEVETAE